MGSALALNPEDYEIDSRVVYYELDLEAVGPSWDRQVMVVSEFQAALLKQCQLGGAEVIT